MNGLDYSLNCGRAKAVAQFGIGVVVHKMSIFTQTSNLQSPPRASLAFRVGIIGHRPDRLPKEAETLSVLRAILRSILADVKAEVSDYAGSPIAATLYSDRPPVVRIVSPLAEGTDRICVEEALELGYQLVCPMPFSQDEFEKDFDPPHALEANSRQHFQGLLKRAKEGAGLTKFELDGKRAAFSEAYGAAGRVVLNQSDLLIAVWDGGKAAGIGGTVDTIQQALLFNLPVLWIDALAPNDWQLLNTADDLKGLEADERYRPRRPDFTAHGDAASPLSATVRRVVHEEIALPQDAPRKKNRAPATQTQAANYFQERKPWLKFAFMWKLFRDAVGAARFQLPRLYVRPFEDQVRDEWPTLDTNDDGPNLAATDVASGNGQRRPSELEDWVNRPLRPHYAWADKLGELYADAYRSAYLLTYLLSATAVFLALLPMAAGWEGGLQIACVAAECVILIGILLLLLFGWRRHWHERWMEYRLLAELIRQLRILIPLGGGRPFTRVSAHRVSYGSLTQTWMYWHMRAIARHTGIPEAKVTPQYVHDCLDYVAKIVAGISGGQLKFHINTEKYSHNIAHRLHKTATVLFGLTIAGILVHLGFELLGMHGRIDPWLVLISATFPALGAALAGINNQGEFARVAKRAGAMADSFQQFSVQIAELRQGSTRSQSGLTLSEALPLAGKIAEVMVDEVSDWRVVFIDRPPTAA